MRSQLEYWMGRHVQQTDQKMNIYFITIHALLFLSIHRVVVG